jgi:SAM-dependent methyltransferase
VTRHEQRLVCKAIAAIVPPPALIVDLPCGTGKLSRVLAATGASIVGGDISLAMMKIARDHYGWVPSFRGFVRFDAATCPFASGSVDCVVSLRLMHRVPPDVRRQILSELARISRRHVVVSYGLTGVRERVRDSIRGLFLDAGTDRQLAVPAAALTHELAEAGLRSVSCQRVLWGLSREVIVLATKIGTALAAAPPTLSLVATPLHAAQDPRR